MARYDKQVGVDICVALGLDATSVKRISFDWTPDKVGDLHVEMLVTENQTDAIVKVLHKYIFEPTEVRGVTCES